MIIFTDNMFGYEKLEDNKLMPELTINVLVLYTQISFCTPILSARGVQKTHMKKSVGALLHIDDTKFHNMHTSKVQSSQAL